MNIYTAIEGSYYVKGDDHSKTYMEYIEGYIQEIEEGLRTDQPLRCSEWCLMKMLDGIPLEEVKERADNMYHIIERLEKDDEGYEDLPSIQKNLKEVSIISSEVLNTGDTLSREDCSDIIWVLANAYYKIENFRRSNDIFFE